MGPLRLDEGLWTPSALGVVGPGLLRGLAAGTEAMYRPLLAVHRDRTTGADAPGPVELVGGDAAWDALAADPQVGSLVGGSFRWLRTHPGAVVVAARPAGRGVGALLGVRPDPLVAGVGEVVLVWTAGPATPSAPSGDLLARAWLRLFQAGAQRGLVGLSVGVTHRGARDVRMLAEVAGFRPAAQVYAEVGLAAADAGVVLDEWRVTVADDEVTDIGLLAAADEASQQELLHRVLPLVTRPGPDPATVEGPYRLSLGGPVTLDGCTGLGPVPEGDWWEPEPDLQPEAARSRAEWVLSRWARRQLGLA